MHGLLVALLIAVAVPDVPAGPSEPDSPFVGTWAFNASKSKVPATYQYRSMTLQFAVVFDTVTIGANYVTTSGEQQIATELFHMDGKEHPGTLNPGVVIAGKWINARLIETSGKRDGQDVGVITYEVSADGKTLTQKYSALPDQQMVFDRK